jgi:hypothetical protein
MNLKNIILLALLFIGLQSFSQLYRFKTSSISVSGKLPTGKWDKWSKEKEANLVISLDSKKDRIIIYSEILQLFDIVEYIDEVVTPTDNTVSFVCKSNDGENCTISIITRKNQNNRMQLYINFDDLILNYNIENLKE